MSEPVANDFAEMEEQGATNFDFEDWASKAGLNRKTTAKIRTAECEGERALKLMTVEDISTLELTLGQRNLLTAAVLDIRRPSYTVTSRGPDREHGPVASTSAATGQTSAVSATQDENIAVDQLLSALQSGIKTSLPTNSGTVHNSLTSIGIDPPQIANVNNALVSRADLDPLVYLANPNSEFLDIIDYVPHFVTEPSRSEQSLAQTEDLHLIIKSAVKKPKLHQVDQASYMAASSRILASMLQNGKISLAQVPQYLAYQVKIGVLAQRYTWYSVLLYDREYRRMQAAFQFPWGSDSQHLAQVHLVDKPKVIPAKPNAVKQSPCRLFNHSTCTYGNACKYAHVCALCRQSHPQSQHQS